MLCRKAKKPERAVAEWRPEETKKGGTTPIIRTYKIRIYPTAEQEEKLWRHIGASRYIWNYMLAEQKRRYEAGEKHLSAFDTIKLLTPLKKTEEYSWLNNVSNTTLQTICRDLDKAYKSCFKKISKAPRFKSRKKAKPNFPVRADAIYFQDGTVNVEKIGKTKYRTDRELPTGRSTAKFTNPRISNVNGKWILTVGVESENQAPTLTDKSMGIDLGVKELAVVEFNGQAYIFHNINKSRKMRQLKQKLKQLQRRISRKYEANRSGTKYNKTRNIEKEEAKLQKLYARIANIRQNYLHQTTHKLVSMLPNRVVMEDLNVTGMMKNKHLSRAIAEQCFSEFIRQMKYKCEWNGIGFIQVGRFYPSSKTCSHCGHIKKGLKLSDRTYECSECGLTIDRDYNAAVNLSKYVV